MGRSYEYLTEEQQDLFESHGGGYTYEDIAENIYIIGILTIRYQRNLKPFDIVL